MKTAALLVALWPALALAQESAPPQPPTPPPPPPPFSGKAELSFVSTSGNTSTQTLGLGAEAVYAMLPWSFGGKLAFVRAESDGETKARALSASLRADRKLAAPFDAFVEARYLKNTFAGVDNRYAIDAGLGFLFFKREGHTARAETALGYTKEDRVTGEDLSFATARLGLGYKWAISKTAELTDDCSFVEDLSDLGDWRAGSVTALSASISTRLSLKASYAFAYVKKPPTGFGRTDTITSVALVAKF
jgi:putative salt-induced outer membrane protein